jgi:hypothetical protein
VVVFVSFSISYFLAEKSGVFDCALRSYGCSVSEMSTSTCQARCNYRLRDRPGL